MASYDVAMWLWSENIWPEIVLVVQAETALDAVIMVLRTRRARVSTGVEGMIGAPVTALTPLLPEGRVNYGGEDWSAVLDPPALSVDTGSELRIVAVDGLLLHVQLATTTPAPVDRNSIEGV